MNLNSLDTRILVDESGITYKEIAATIGITPEYLSRCLQKGVKPIMRRRIEGAIEKIKRGCKILKVEEFIPRHFWLEYWYYADETMNEIDAYLQEVYIVGEDNEGIETRLIDSPCDDWMFEFKKYNKQELDGWRIWDKKPENADRKQAKWVCDK